MDWWLTLLLLGLAPGVGIALLMLLAGDLRPSELRERLIGSVLNSYTYQGWTIPGRKRGPLASLVLWLLRYEGPDAPRLRLRGLPLFLAR